MSTQAVNATTLREISSLIGTGLTYALGDPFLIGVIVLLFFIGMMYALGFTPDVVLPVIVLLVLVMGGLAVTPALYAVFPPWAIGIVALVTGTIGFYAFMRIMRR